MIVTLLYKQVKFESSYGAYQVNRRNVKYCDFVIKNLKEQKSPRVKVQFPMPCYIENSASLKAFRMRVLACVCLANRTAKENREPFKTQFRKIY